MKQMYMLDTDICSYLINGRSSETLKNMVKKRHEQLCISAITCAELNYGAIRKKSDTLTKSVNLFQQLIGNIIPWTVEAALSYAEIRAFLESDGVPLGNMDLLIAASALAENTILISNNTKHFSRIPALKLQNWQEEIIS